MVDETVKAMTERLMKSAASTLELALTRYDAAAKQDVLAYAKELLRSDDPSERALGLKLEAEVLRDNTEPTTLVLEAPENGGAVGIGGTIDPLSHRSSLALPDMGMPSAESGNGEVSKRGPGRPRKHKSNGEVPKRGPGRPRKHKSNGEVPKRGPGRPRKSEMGD